MTWDWCTTPVCTIAAAGAAYTAGAWWMNGAGTAAHKQKIADNTMKAFILLIMIAVNDATTTQL